MGAALRVRADEPADIHEPHYWWNVIAAVWPRTDVSPRAKHLLVTLVTMAGGRNGWVEASLGDIAYKAGVSVSKTARARDELCRLRYVTWDSLGAGFVHRFQINGELLLPCPNLRQTDVPHVKLTYPSPPHTPPVGEFNDLTTAAAGAVFLAQEKTEPELTDDEIAFIRECMAFSKKISAGSVLAALGDYTVEDLRVGLVEARRMVRTGQAIRSMWGLILAVAERNRHERDLEASAARLGLKFDQPTAPPRHVAVQVADAVITVSASADEVRGMVNLARGHGPMADMYRRHLRACVVDGTIPRELVPAELLDDEQGERAEPAAGLVAKLPPQPVGGPSPDATTDSTADLTPSKITVESRAGHAPGRIRTYNLRIRSPRDFQPEHLEPPSLAQILAAQRGGIVEPFRPFSLPDSERKPSTGALYRGSGIRDTMRC